MLKTQRVCEITHLPRIKVKSLVTLVCVTVSKLNLTVYICQQVSLPRSGLKPVDYQQLVCIKCFMKEQSTAARNEQRISLPELFKRPYEVTH